MKKALLLTVLVSISIANVVVAQKNAAPKPNSRDSVFYDKSDSVPAPVVTHHQTTIDGKLIHYTATTGYMSMKDSIGRVMAKIFYIAYTNEEGGSKQPITFVFNGGPGSSSIWLHMGAIGPVKVVYANDKGDAPVPPYTYSDNPDSWIGFTDLVFIDPVSTGYSRPNKGVSANRFHGYSEDIRSVGDFIRLYTTRNERWGSPKFLAGESYGTIRASGLSGYLQDAYGMYLNGITLVSSVLNFQLIDFTEGNEIPYAMFFPTYATTAQYYKKLSPELQNLSVAQLAAKAETFAQGTYNQFLMLGDKASPELTNKVIDSMSYFTGIPKDYIKGADERITAGRFFKEVLRSEGKTVGRYDSRFSGEDADDVGEYDSYDPSYSNISGLYNEDFNAYIRQDLGYKSDLPYAALTNVYPWNYSQFTNSYLDVSETLRDAMTKNPHLKVMVCCGYYDLATPFFNAEYAVNHLGLRPDVRSNISLTYYNAGHMVYVNKPDNDKLKADAQAFYTNALK